MHLLHYANIETHLQLQLIHQYIMIHVLKICFHSDQPMSVV
jgi:hypothetical protein